MGKNTSISLEDHFEKFIKSEISEGKYGSVSEVVRTALRLLESEQHRIKSLRKALELGETGDFISDFDSKAHLARIHRMHI